MIGVVVALVLIALLVTVAALVSGMPFKQLLEMTVAIGTIVGVTVAAIGFYYASREKMITFSMDRMMSAIDKMNDNPQLQCVWEGKTSCVLDTKDKLDLIVILKNLDASIYMGMTDPSVHFIVGELMSLPLVYDAWYDNRVYFSERFNKYVFDVTKNTPRPSREEILLQ